MKTIGLIGGMSWESSAVYYQIINRRTRDLLGGSHSAETLMYSVDFDTVARLQHDGNWAELERMMVDAAKRLEAGGADLVVLCTNTMHKLAGAIEAAVAIRFLHIGDATGQAIRRAGLTKVGLLGTRFTMEEDFLKSRLAERFDVETIIPDADDRETVHSIIYEELVKGEVRDESRRRYLEVIDKLRAAGAEGIVLGCTEIPLLVTPDSTDAVLFDTTRIHAEMAVEIAIDAANGSFPN